MQNGLKVYLQQIVGENPNKMELARTTKVPYHILVDIFRGKTQRPDPEVLESMAVGLGVSYDDLALAAYGRLVRRDPAGADDTLEEAAPPASNGTWNKPAGTRRLKASAAT